MRNTTLPELPTHPRIIDPRTGDPLRALAIIGGRPVWPIMGASDPVPGGGQPPAAPPAPPAPAPNGQQAGQGATPEPPDEPLGDAGKQTLVKVRTLLKEAEARAEAAEKERDELKTAGQTEQEKAVAAARAEGISAANQRLVRAEVKAAAAAAGFHDPADAAVQLHGELAKVAISKDGDVDEAKVKELVASLATSKPYLVKTAGATPPAALPGQGNHQPAPKTGAAAGLAEAERRFGKPAATKS